MKRVVVRYRVKPERVAEHESYIRKVFEELANTAPAGLRYAAFKAADGVSFVHIASIETEDGANPLSRLTAFQAFVSGIQERCDEPPSATDVTVVGSYQLLGS